jgi:hypothetical protein
MAIPVTDSRTLNTLVTSAIDTISGNPANLVTEGGEKVLAKLAKRGRIFKVNDAERVEHPVMTGTDASWATLVGDVPSGTPTDGSLVATQSEVLTKALHTILTRTKNFNVPQSMIGRSSQLAMSDIAYLAQRMAMEAYAMEEAYLLRGASTLSGSYDYLAPFSGDSLWKGGASVMGSMSLLGLLGVGLDTATDTFGGIAVDDDADWAAQNTAVTNANPNDATKWEEFLGDIQGALINADYGGMERPTDIITTIDAYERILVALRNKGTINDTLIRDMGVAPDTEIPFGSVLIDYSRHLDKGAVWDMGDGATSCHPIVGLNLNSLRWNLVGQTSGVGEDAGWIDQKSDMQPHPTLSNFFKRLEYRFCFSIDNGRRSFFNIEGLTL